MTRVHSKWHFKYFFLFYFLVSVYTFERFVARKLFWSTSVIEIFYDRLLLVHPWRPRGSGAQEKYQLAKQNGGEEKFARLHISSALRTAPGSPRILLVMKTWKFSHSNFLFSSKKFLDIWSLQASNELISNEFLHMIIVKTELLVRRLPFQWC